MPFAQTSTDRPTIDGTQVQTVFGQTDGKSFSTMAVKAPPTNREEDPTTLNAAADSGTAAKITGLAQDGSMPTALAINTTAVGAPLAIQLDNVDFAVVIGQAALAGGAGNQTVFGDSAAQYLLSGEGDDYLSGGGNNDTVASTLGNDTLFRGAGDDTLLGGAGATTWPAEPGTT